MSEKQTHLKIEIPIEDETPFVPEQPKPTATSAMLSTGVDAVKSQAGKAAKMAWDSNLRKKATGGMKRGAKAVAGTVAAKSQKVVQERMVKAAEEQTRQQTQAIKTKIRETDWQHEAKQGTASGLRWLSAKLAELAARFSPKEDAEIGD